LVHTLILKSFSLISTDALRYY